MFDVSIVCRPGGNCPTNFPSRKNSATSSAPTVSCAFMGIVRSGCL